MHIGYLDSDVTRVYLTVHCHMYSGRVGVAAIAKKIYAIGGYDGLSNLNSVEMYDTEKEEWSAAPPMHSHQGGVGVAVMLRD